MCNETLKLEVLALAIKDAFHPGIEDLARQRISLASDAIFRERNINVQPPLQGI